MSERAVLARSRKSRKVAQFAKQASSVPGLNFDVFFLAVTEKTAELSSPVRSSKFF